MRLLAVEILRHHLGFHSAGVKKRTCSGNWHIAVVFVKCENRSDLVAVGSRRLYRWYYKRSKQGRIRGRKAYPLNLGSPWITP